MSLVAAYSDSEGESDNENEQKESGQSISEDISKPQKEEVRKDIENDDTEIVNFEIEDEDDWRGAAAAKDNQTAEETEIFSKLPEPEPVHAAYSLTEEVEDEFLKKKPTTEDTLYKKEQALLEKEQGGEKGSHSNKKNQNFLTKFTKKGGKKKNQRIQISIPTLQEIGADSDSDPEDQGPQTQEFQGSKKSSALFSMLPKPKNSVTVGANKNKMFTKETNRPLVPHTLTKKKEPSKPASVKKPTTVSSVPNDDEESDDEDDANIASSFFSFGESSSGTAPKLDMKKQELEPKGRSKTNDVHKPIADSVKTVVQPALVVVEKESRKDTASQKNTKNNTFFANLFNKNKTSSSSTGPSATDTVSSKDEISKSTLVIQPNATVSLSSTVKTEPQNMQTSYGVTAPYGVLGNMSVTAPLNAQFAGNLNTSYGVTAPYGVESPSHTQPNSDPVTAPYGSYAEQQTPNTSGDTASQQFFSYSHATNTKEAQQPFDYYNQPNEDLPIEQDAIQALQGRKRRREEINLIDVNAQDLQSTSEEYLRNLTVDSGYKPKQAKGFGPSGQQKKKHQITYLAFQAKEREFELRQSWADSRASKQQTQSRYGF